MQCSFLPFKSILSIFMDKSQRVLSRRHIFCCDVNKHQIDFSWKQPTLPQALQGSKLLPPCTGWHFLFWNSHFSLHKQVTWHLLLVIKIDVEIFAKSCKPILLSQRQEGIRRAGTLSVWDHSFLGVRKLRNGCSASSLASLDAIPHSNVNQSKASNKPRDHIPGTVRSTFHWPTELHSLLHSFAQVLAFSHPHF